MKTAAVALWLSCAFLCCAQDANPEIKRLQSVTWDLATHKLVWTVEKGSLVDGEFVPSAAVKYEVSPDEAFMAFDGEQRSFGLQEAVALHRVLDTLSLYCVESVVWWNKHAEKDSDDPATSTPVISKPDVKPLKVGMVQRPPRLGPF
jgi:hypothetical protein